MPYRSCICILYLDYSSCYCDYLGEALKGSVYLTVFSGGEGFRKSKHGGRWKSCVCVWGREVIPNCDDIILE